MENQPVPNQIPQAELPPSAPIQPVIELPAVPTIWPGAWGIYKYSKQAVSHNWTTLLGLIGVSFAVSIVLQAVLGRSAIAEIISEFVSMLLGLVTLLVYLPSVKSQKISFGSAFGLVTPLLFLKYLGNILLLAIILIGSSLLLVVPFFFVLPRVILAPYFVAYKNLGPLAAITASWHATQGHAGKVWGMIGAFFVMALLLITIIGIPFALYFLFMYGACFTIFYEYLIASEGQSFTASPNTSVDPSAIDPTTPATASS